MNESNERINWEEIAILRTEKRFNADRKEVITKWILPILTLISGIVIGIVGMM